MFTTNRGRRPRRVVGRHFGKIVVPFAVAVTAVAMTAPGASASVPVEGGGATACVFHTLRPSHTYNRCVKDEQVLLNDLFVRKIPGVYRNVRGPDRWLKTDGIYGPNTSKDVAAFNNAWFGPAFHFGNITVRSFYPNSPGTWDAICYAMHHHGLAPGSKYYRAAGCQLIQP